MVPVAAYNERKGRMMHSLEVVKQEYDNAFRNVCEFFGHDAPDSVVQEAYDRREAEMLEAGALRVLDVVEHFAVQDAVAYLQDLEYDQKCSAYEMAHMNENERDER